MGQILALQNLDTINYINFSFKLIFRSEFDLNFPIDFKYGLYLLFVRVSLMTESNKITEIKNISNKWDVSAMYAVISHLFEVRPLVYWFDLLFSSLVGWSFFGICINLPFLSFAYVFCLLIAAFALYRALSFMHELVHLRKNAIPGFHLVWIMLIGAPLMVPSFLYVEIHLSHHNKNKFGTELDGEYAPFAWTSLSFILKHFLGHFLLPLFIVFRFAILAPISFLHPRIRAFIKVNFSAVSIRMPFKREVSSKPEDQRLWFWEEAATSGFLWSVLVLIGFGILPQKLILQYVLTAILIAVLNSVRTLGATHRYLSRGKEMSFQNQFNDSVNIQSSRVDNLLFCPVGLRYHALHHLFPGLPYHSLRAGHQCLTKSLPPDHEYHLSTLPTVWSGWEEMLTNIDKNQASLAIAR